jgi:hypothetical protein
MCEENLVAVCGREILIQPSVSGFFSVHAKHLAWHQLRQGKDKDNENGCEKICYRCVVVICLSISLYRVFSVCTALWLADQDRKHVEKLHKIQFPCKQGIQYSVPVIFYFYFFRGLLIPVTTVHLPCQRCFGSGWTAGVAADGLLFAGWAPSMHHRGVARPWAAEKRAAVAAMLVDEGVLADVVRIAWRKDFGVKLIGLRWVS